MNNIDVMSEENFDKKRRMVYTLKITNFIDQIMAKMAAIDQFIELNPVITARIDYHDTAGRRVLLSNEYRELANEWNSLQTRGLTNHMHGVRSIISHTRHKVRTTLKIFIFIYIYKRKAVMK